MEGLAALAVSIIQTSLLDITLSGDNVRVIALAVRNLPEKHAKLPGIIADICMGLDNILAIAGAAHGNI